MPPETRPRGRILLIDDQESTRYIFGRILTRAGFQVEEAATGAEGLTMATSLPDLIIADVNLPDILGYDVCRRLRSNPLTTAIPVLQVSASFVTDESKVHALQGGADSYLTQPVEPAVLLAQVHALLRLRRAEALSSLTARQWQTTFNSLSDGLALVDDAGIVVRVNRTFLNLLDFAPSDIEGRPLAAVIHNQFDISAEELLKTQGDQRTVRGATDGRWFRVRFDPIDSGPEDPSGAVFLLSDITENQKLQASLKLTERLATTGRLAHIIAHEINNPLEALANLIYLALQGTMSLPEEHGYLQQASSELERISQITRQVLAYHRDSKSPMSFRARELLEPVLVMFRTQMLLQRIELNVTSRCTDPVTVHPGEIRQVFSNIIGNALDVLRGDGGCLRIRCIHSTEQATGRKGVRFLFSDTGPGIPSDVVPRVFDAFFTTKETQGSGIGLWLSAEVLAKHHGSIRLRTRTEGPYRGTLFAIFLPLAAPFIL